MAKIRHEIKVTLEFEDADGGEIGRFEITWRELGKKEKRRLSEETKGLFDKAREAASLGEEIRLLEEEKRAYTEMGESAKVVETIEKIRKLRKKVDAIRAEIEADGELDDPMEYLAKKTFDLAVGGKDKERLAAFVDENYDYAEVLDAIRQEAEAAKKKR